MFPHKLTSYIATKLKNFSILRNGTDTYDDPPTLVVDSFTVFFAFILGTQNELKTLQCTHTVYICRIICSEVTNIDVTHIQHKIPSTYQFHNLYDYSANHHQVMVLKLPLYLCSKQMGYTAFQNSSCIFAPNFLKI